MKHITKVVVENFQSHARSELAFGPGLNVIIGPSDNGKSAVLRAVRWALYNEPRGSEFVRSGARECRVSVTMSDGVEVVRELILTKSGAASRNRYILRAPEQEPQVFEGFGGDVPAEVTKAHGMPQVLLDTDKKVGLSFGSQLEGPFLMAESGSLRARAIGRLLGVHVVDAAMRNTQKDQRMVKQEIVKLEQRLEQYDQDLLPYADIPEQEARLEAAEALLATVERLQQRLGKLEALRDQFDRTDREEIVTQAQLGRLDGLEEAEHGLKQAEERHRHGAKLERFSQDFARVDLEGRTYKTRIDALTALPIAEQRAREAAERQLRLTSLARIDEDLKRRDTELGRLARELARLEAVPHAAVQVDGAAERIGRLTALVRIDEELKRRETELSRLGREVARLESVPVVDERLHGAGAALQRLDVLEQKLGALAELNNRLAAGREHVVKVEADLGQSLAEYEQVLRRMGTCPTCMQPVPAASVKRIIAELAGGPSSGHHHG
jgi:DNA repair protein SbcC/Rad50